MKDVLSLSLVEAARIVGCHPITLRRAIARGELSYLRLFGRIRVLPEDLQAFVARTYHPTPGEDPRREAFAALGRA
jgi:excisionase family DNA binding protein